MAGVAKQTNYLHPTSPRLWVMLELTESVLCSPSCQRLSESVQNVTGGRPPSARGRAHPC